MHERGMNMGGTLKYAEHKLDEAIRQGEPDIDIAYWRGYRDCAKALEKDHFLDSTKMMPLTLEQLRRMDGRPVWVEDMEKPKKSGWRLIYWDRGKYLVLLAKSAVGYILEDYGETWIAYYHRPAHIDREAWARCEMCVGAKTLYQNTNNTKLFMNTFGSAATLVTECNACPPHADCCMKGVPVNSVFKINFCPGVRPPADRGSLGRAGEAAEGVITMFPWLCWYVSDEWGCYIIAPNRGRAKSLFNSYWRGICFGEYTDVRATKIKAADGYEEAVMDMDCETLAALDVHYDEWRKA